ncbi:MAG: M1 family metallopeptidase [Bacteroidota bacterium]
MKKVFIGLFLVFTWFQHLNCQNYFQQEVNFNISVTLDDKTHSLQAFESVEYINNSTDTLYMLYFHIWPNAYKNKNTALARQQIKVFNNKLYNSSEDKRGYIDSLDFKINDKSIKWQYDDIHIDICKIYPDNVIKPGDTVFITTPFYVKIPSSDFSRLGHDGQSYQITQWFPKPAVYDMYGWHAMPYLDIGEFYSEFGSFEVKITLPENYIVAATGNLMNQDELKKLNTVAEETKEIEYFDERDNSFPASSSIMKTLIYKEKNIHDFAWFADKRFHVLKGKTILPNSGDTVITWAMFTNYDGNLWKHSIKYINDALIYYSGWYGDYPYKNCTAVDGVLAAGGGMEYPTITIIGSSSNSLSLEQVIMHEVGHNWFYGILGSNERDFPWMDEGLNTFSDTRYTITKYPNLKFYESEMSASLANFLDVYHLPYIAMLDLAYQFNARRGMDEAANKHSELYSAVNYFTIVYMKNAYIFNYLMNYLGQEEFYRIMKKYYESWKFKHPYPDDFINVFKQNCNKDLSWFFNDVLGTDNHIDYKIKQLKKDGKNYKLTIKNRGNINAPSYYSLINADDDCEKIWFEGFEKRKEFSVMSGDFDKIVMDPDRIVPDIYRKNNQVNKSGLFRKTEPVKLKFLGSVENPNVNYLYYMPVIGWNLNNGFMPGFLFYNSLVPMKKTEFQIMPMYSTTCEDIAGGARFQHHIFPQFFFRRVDITASASQYAIDDSLNYQRYQFSTEFWLKNEDLANTIENRFNISATAVSDIEHLVIDRHQVCKLFGNFLYTHSNVRKINPYNFKLYFNGNKDFLKGMIEARYKITYDRINKGLNIRLFAGKFLYKENKYYGNYNFRLSGWNGYNDYMYDYIYLGRSGSHESSKSYLLENQFIPNDGAFSIYTGLGQTDDWLLTLNLSSTLPFKLPLKIYGNFGTYANIEDDYNLSEWAVYELGVSLLIIPEIFEIYFPAFLSKDIKATSDYYYNNYWQKVRFTLNLNRLDPFKFMQNFNI